MSSKIFFVFLSLCNILMINNVAMAGRANDILPKYGLPIGLIPDSVTSYTFSNSTGEFELILENPCYARFGSHLVYYQETIKGKLSYRAISDLSGIQAKKLFLWVPVTGIVAHHEEGKIEFQVGFISESLPESAFEKVQTCSAEEMQVARLRGAAGVIGELGLLPTAEA